jgi:hypothetical protein
MKSLLQSILILGLFGSIFACNSSDSSFGPAQSTSGSNGTGGSMARFAIVDSTMYSVDDNKLYVFDISNDQNPVQLNSLSLAEGIETIFPYGDYLFLGTRTGIFIIDINDRNNPFSISGQTVAQRHVTSCDPVVVNDSIGFVTLRMNSTACGNFIADSRLEILDIKDYNNTNVIATHQLESPYGLALKGNYLYVCDGAAGLKVFDVSDPYTPTLLKTYGDIEVYDVIPNGAILMVIGPKNLFQFDMSNPLNMVEISRIKIAS